MTAEHLYEHYQREPVVFMRERLGFRPWSKQVEIITAVRDHPRVAVKACNASGKTAIAGRGIVPWWLSGGPGSIVLTTAPTERQVKKVLWREVHQGMRSRSARDFFRGATITDTEIFLRHDWFATGLTADDVESFQGFHGARLLVIVDEASGVDERIYGAIEGVLASGDATLLLIGNPLRTSGTFYDAFNSDRDSWKLITISAFDTPNLSGEEVDKEVARRLVARSWVDRAARHGTAGNEYRIRVLGEFPRESDDTVVNLGDLETAQQVSLEPGWPLIISVDVARYGSDHTVLGVRRGNVFRLATSYRGRATTSTVGEIVRLAHDLLAQHERRPVIVVDDAGVGGGVTDRLVELDELKVIPYNAARAAKHPRDYPNRRSEDWFALSDLLSEIDLDPDEGLAADLLAPRYSLDSSGRRVVEPKAETKRRLRRSPDKADALIMAYSIERPGRWGRFRKPAKILEPLGQIGDALPRRPVRGRAVRDPSGGGVILNPNAMGIQLPRHAERRPTLEEELHRAGVPVAHDRLRDLDDVVRRRL